MENIDKQSDPITTNQVIVIVETAKEQVKLKTAYNVKAATALGIVHIMCGFITLSAEIAVNYSFGIFDIFGIFASLLFLLSGVLTISGARIGRKCLVVVSMVTDIISVIAGGILLIMSTIELSLSETSVQLVSFALLVAMGTTMPIIAIASASLTCLPLCCRPKKQVIVNYKPKLTMCLVSVVFVYLVVKLFSFVFASPPMLDVWQHCQH